MRIERTIKLKCIKTHTVLLNPDEFCPITLSNIIMGGGGWWGEETGGRTLFVVDKYLYREWHKKWFIAYSVGLHDPLHIWTLSHITWAIRHYFNTYNPSLSVRPQCIKIQVCAKPTVVKRHGVVDAMGLSESKNSGSSLATAFLYFCLNSSWSQK